MMWVKGGKKGGRKKRPNKGGRGRRKGARKKVLSRGACLPWDSCARKALTHGGTKHPQQDKRRTTDMEFIPEAQRKVSETIKTARFSS